MPFVAFLSSSNTISDGWYEAEIKTDSVLATRLSKLKYGAKILVTNAKYQPGHKEAESPIESPLKLELHANGVTAIKSSETVKLGEFRKFPIFPLKTLVPNGGMTTRIKLLILREYPSLYFVDDQNAKYGSKRRAITKRQFEAEQQKRQARSDTEFSAFMERSDKEERSEIDPELKNVSTKKFKTLTHGCDIYEALQASNDIDFLSSIMTMEQRVQVEKHKETGFRIL